MRKIAFIALFTSLLASAGAQHLYVTDSFPGLFYMGHRGGIDGYRKYPPASLETPDTVYGNFHFRVATIAGILSMTSHSDQNFNALGFTLTGDDDTGYSVIIQEPKPKINLQLDTVVVWRQTADTSYGTMSAVVYRKLLEVRQKQTAAGIVSTPLVYSRLDGTWDTGPAFLYQHIKFLSIDKRRLRKGTIVFTDGLGDGIQQDNPIGDPYTPAPSAFYVNPKFRWDQVFITGDTARMLTGYVRGDSILIDSAWGGGSLWVSPIENIQRQIDSLKARPEVYLDLKGKKTRGVWVKTADKSSNILIRKL